MAYDPTEQSPQNGGAPPASDLPEDIASFGDLSLTERLKELHVNLLTDRPPERLLQIVRDARRLANKQ